MGTEAAGDRIVHDMLWQSINYGYKQTVAGAIEYRSSHCLDKQCYLKKRA